MDVFLVAAIGSCTAIVVFFLMSWLTKGREKDPVETIKPEWVARIEVLEARFEQLRGDYLETLERANRQFARARATEAAIERKRGMEEEEDEPLDLGQLSLLDGGEREGEGVSPMYPDLEGLPPHLQYAKTMARRLIQGT